MIWIKEIKYNSMSITGLSLLYSSQVWFLFLEELNSWALRVSIQDQFKDMSPKVVLQGVVVKESWNYNNFHRSNDNSLTEC